MYDKIGVKAGETELLKPCGDEESFEGRFTKKEVKENKERVIHFFFNIGDYEIEAEEERGYKINSIDGNNCYNYTYRYVVHKDNIRIVSSEENGLDATVTETLDYGNVCYAKAVTADGQSFLVKVDRGFAEDKIRIAFNSSDVSVYSTRIDMILC